MTRVIIFYKPDSFSVVEVDMPPDGILSAVKSGGWQQFLPGHTGKVKAHQHGEMVILTTATPEPGKTVPTFSERERQVLQLLCEGLTTAQVALRLGLSARTIRGYIARMKTRLQANNIPQLLAIASSAGLLDTKR